MLQGASHIGCEWCSSTRLDVMIGKRGSRKKGRCWEETILQDDSRKKLAHMMGSTHLNWKGKTGEMPYRIWQTSRKEGGKRTARNGSRKEAAEVG